MTPARYIEIEDKNEKEDPFDERFLALKNKYYELQNDSHNLSNELLSILKKLITIDMFLSDIAEINPETKKHFDDQEHINYLETSNITKNFIGDFQSLIVGKDKIPSRAKRKVRDKDIVYSTIRPINLHYGFLGNLPMILLFLQVLLW